MIITTDLNSIIRDSHISIPLNEFFKSVRNGIKYVFIHEFSHHTQTCRVYRQMSATKEIKSHFKGLSSNHLLKGCTQYPFYFTLFRGTAKERTSTIVSTKLYIFRHSLDVLHIDVELDVRTCAYTQLSMSHARLSL